LDREEEEADQEQRQEQVYKQLVGCRHGDTC
jgi:hypothetical protein